MQSHQWAHRLPDWRAAAMAGVAGGVVFLVLDLMASALSGAGLWAPTHMIAAIVMGSGALASPASFSFGIVVTALIVHFVLAIAMGLILGLIMAPFHFDSSWGMASAVGAVFGLAVYLFNFYGMTSFFPWFAEARGWITLIAHVIFGIVMADAYLKMEAKEEDRSGSALA
ncbi:hypothetical protein QU487_21040 [Crenobacter sp. SG2305]|uniref:hypothetical protein n=1 Tax=Crenobacter oryzisoli TaxID=3056844 RepID=UPI0025AB4DBD|nr:hypothetical protein [Crenobacter sp. SG2305]MDN0085197.1 hypothetical protein [Crenobacter sp. SG2305]